MALLFLYLFVYVIRMMIKKLIFLFLWVFYCGLAQAHVAGVTDTEITIHRSHLALTFTVPEKHLKTLESALTPDASLIEVIKKGFSVTTDDKHCGFEHKSTGSLENIDSRQFIFNVDCQQTINVLKVDYNLFFDLDDTHKNVTRMSLRFRSQNLVYTKDKRTHSIPVIKILKQWQPNNAKTEPVKQDWMSNSHYFPLGLEHILKGTDHILFLLALLIVPMTLRRVLLLVTCFTIAHSVTLALSILDIIVLPVLWVEAAIALSIVLVAVTNIFKLNHPLRTANESIKPRLITTFLFGLIHGFGFSFFLKELGLGNQVLPALAFFNVGVEVGQLIIVALAVPLIGLLFKRKHGHHGAQVLSIIIAFISVMWMVERVGAIIPS